MFARVRPLAPLDISDRVTQPVIRNRVLLALSITAGSACWALPFLRHAPNRLLSGQPVSLSIAIDGLALIALLPGLVVIAGAFLPQRRHWQILIASAAAVFLVALWWVAGRHAALLAEGAPTAARTSLGAAFWSLFVCAALALIDTMRRLNLGPTASALIGITIGGAIALLAMFGGLNQLSLAKEFANRRDTFDDAVVRHILIVLGALLPTLALGAPLGVLAHRRARVAAALFPILNIVQTIPSIALFGVLIAPLSGLAAIFPGLAALGISGIGVAPAIIALVFYSLLPIVRNTVEGLAGVRPSAIEAARGMGMTRSQMFWRVELPLALPVFLSGVRITIIQAIGLAAVAALIGAGGLGAIMFQGLFDNALDLAMLGAVPVILLAVIADALLRLLAAYAQRRPG